MSDEIENTPVEAPVAEEKFDNLPQREAISKAMEVFREGEDRSAREVPTKKEIVAAVNADPEPPSEFNAAEKEAWRKKDIAGIHQGYQRINSSRLQELSRAQTEEKKAKEEAKTWRELGNMAAPYIEARGADGVTPQQAIMEALALIQEFKKADPTTVKAELKRIGIDLDASPSSAQSKALDPDFASLQKEFLELKSERESEKAQQYHSQVVGAFDQTFAEMAALKNRTGDPVFPDLLDKSEKGMRLCARIGSVVRNPEFQAGVLEDFPDADFKTMVREAYRIARGKVVGEPVTTVSTSNQTQKHYEKSRRAAASSPIGATVKSRSESSNLVGKLSMKAAIRKALEDQREH